MNADVKITAIINVKNTDDTYVSNLTLVSTWTSLFETKVAYPNHHD